MRPRMTVTVTTKIRISATNGAILGGPAVPPGAAAASGSRLTQMHTRTWRDSVASSAQSIARRERRAAPDNSKRWGASRSAQHTSGLHSRQYLLCRLLLEQDNDVRRH